MRKYVLISLLAMVIMVVLYGLTTGGVLGDNPVGTTGTDSNPLIVPSGYAFSIWGLIYLGLIIFPIYHWFKTPQNQHKLWGRIHSWYTINVVCNGLWLVCASYDWLWLTVAIIIIMLMNLVMINRDMIRIEEVEGVQHYWLEKFPFSIYFAWITLATALNISSALAFYNWNGLGISEINWTIVIMIVAAAIAGHIAYHKRDRAYAGVVIWAFIAIALRHWGSIQSISILAIGVVALFAGMIVLLSRRNSLSM
jgi:hypothetical protein